ncbi:blue (type 1) copper domain protein (plasmid) [Alkalihalophilus pseudofirmus OF4]|uniref:Blue (Type 1) copper domain protein n=1 Tax=Alkalihalophilus pseudofirmus (strain ATCC BAA-2126 / JCM 17055 / OF4) TaxID=398511 RepID=D3G156_ALKPO|nr:cupredoxin domain-containing protein [Alkalihalophilus pseudofirmus]ADC52082.1 blue (type 1) copper domain protein [Alkalihalophilus pseudofirmus OF4]
MLKPLVLIIIFILLLIWLISLSYFFKEKLSNMIGMVVSMTLGMITGLSIGTFSAIFFPNFFFEMTVLSMLVGGIIGVVTGFPHSLIAIIDGLLSGVMGGMMGTMLGVMISPEHYNQILNIMSLWTVGIFFLIYLLLIYEINMVTNKKSLTLHPLPYFTLVCSFILGFHYFTIEFNDRTNHHANHVYNQEVIVAANEYQFGPDQVQVSPGEEVTLTLVNNGIEQHDFEIKGLDFHLHAMPGTSESKSIVFPKSGSYEVICTIQGHESAGMTATIIVTEL